MAASANDLLVKTGEGTATTLSSPGYTIGATSVTVVSTTNWPTDTGVIFAIDTAEIVNGEQVQVAGTYTEYRGVVSGATSITSVALVTGTPQNYSAGALTRVYIPLSSEVQNRMVDGLLVSHTQTGAMIPSLPLTTPKITTSINDANGNEVIVTPATASAVNEITVTNAATGNPSRVAASGGDTNIDAYFSGKGTGSARFAGPHDGWVACDETLTYASASTFTCSAALAAVLSVGDRLKFTQTTVKYFLITGISGTTVTVLVNTDYTIANAAITLPFYSKSASPTGFPTYFNVTPAWTNVTVGNGTQIGRISLIGKQIFYEGSLTLGTTSSVTGTIILTIPATMNTYIADAPLGTAYFNNIGVESYTGTIGWASTTTTRFNGPNGVADTRTALAAAAKPVAAWGSTDTISFSMVATLA